MRRNIQQGICRITATSLTPHRISTKRSPNITSNTGTLRHTSISNMHSGAASIKILYSTIYAIMIYYANDDDFTVIDQVGALFMIIFILYQSSLLNLFELRNSNYYNEKQQILTCCKVILLITVYLITI